MVFPVLSSVIPSDRRCRLLLVEDDLDDRQLLSSDLRAAAGPGLVIEAVGRLEQALARLEDAAFDVALLDLDLPDSRGLATVEGVLRVRPRLPVVVLTGLAEAEFARRAIQAGAQDYLLKGAVPGPLLWSTVQRAIERTRMEDRLRTSEALHRSVVGVLSEGVVVHDADGRIITSNESASRILGLSAEQIEGKDPVDAAWRCLRADGSTFPGDEHPAMQTLRTGQPLRQVLMGVDRVDGTRAWISINTQPIVEPGEKRPRLVVASFRDITTERAAEEALRATLVEKDMLLREIHHRVKNNLQVISSLLALQALRADDSRLEQMLEDSQARIRTMGLIHEKLYGSRDVVHFSFAEYLRELVELVARVNRRKEGVETVVRATPLPVSFDQAVPLALIATELITNALRHAFPDGRVGRIQVEFDRLADGRVELAVMDNGVGPPPASESEVRKTGLGHELIEVLSRQLHGEFVREVRGGLFAAVRFRPTVVE